MIRSRLSALLIGAALALLAPGAHSAQLIVNGGFENEGTGWNVASQKVAFTDIVEYNACCAPFGTYQYGIAAAFFGDNDTPTGGVLFQDVVTIPGAFYTLTWAYGAISETWQQKMLTKVIDLGSSTTLGMTTSTAFGTQNLTTMMDPLNLIGFTALGSLTRVSFSDISIRTISVDGVLDNVSLTGPAPIPEPSTYLLMIAGLGLVIFATRRRAAARGAAA